MKFLYLILACLFGSVLLGQNLSPYGQFKIKNFAYSDYSGNAQNWRATQDAQNRIVVANNGKTLVFDGLSWIGIDLENGENVRSVKKDPNGKVYVGGKNEFGYLTDNEWGQVSYVKISDDLDSIAFEDIWEIHFIDDLIYFFSRKYIFIYTDESTPIQIIEPPRSSSVQYAHKINGNSLVVNVNFSDESTESVIYMMNGTEFTEVKNSTEVVPILCFERDDKTYLLTKYGKMFQLNLEDYSIKPLKNLDLGNFPKREIYCGLTTPAGICLGTSGDGIYFYDYNGKLIRHVNEKEGLSNLSIRHLYFDHLCNLWVCYDNGIGFLETSSPVVELNEKNGINVITEDIFIKDSIVYLATHSDLFFGNVNEGNIQFTSKNLLKQDLFQVKEFTFTNGKTFILVIANNGIFAIDEQGNAEFIAEYVYAWEMNQSKANPNLIHLGMDGDGLGKLVYNGDKFTFEGTYEDTDGDVRSIVETDHMVYFGIKGKGVFKLNMQNNNEVTEIPGLITYENDQSTEEHFQLCMFQDTIFVGSVNGLYKIVNDELIPANYPGLELNHQQNYAYRLRNDNDEFLWIVFFKNSGEENEYQEIGYVNPSGKNGYEWISAPFKEIAESVIYDIKKDPQGNYWFAGSDRVCVYYPSIEFRYDTVAPPMIQKVTLNDDSTFVFNPMLAQNMTNSFEYEYNTVTFYFTSTSYTHRFQNEYSWYLEGEDENWTEWKNTNSIDYQRLSEGVYTFHLKTRNFYDIESPETSFTFTIKPPWYRTWWAYLIYFILIVFVIYIAIRLSIRRVKQQNERLEEIVEERTAEIAEQNAVLENQKAEIQAKTNDILDSIVYAKRIQNTILPTTEKMKTHFNSDHFVLYKPKDIVSGDFYWTGKVDGKTIFAAIDCTGHGVPGAFVSIVGFNGMNRAINEFKKRQPAEILNQLREIVVETFSQSDSNVKDGMDIALCSLDYETKTLEYAGANNPVLILRNGEFIEIKANKQPIGEFETAHPFDNHTFQLQSGDLVYIFSDGYADQFGGDKGKKLKSKNLKSLLIQYSTLSMEEQRIALDNAFEEWKGNFEQLDDVCLIGVKIE